MHSSIFAILVSMAVPAITAFPAGALTANRDVTASITLRTGDGDSSVGFTIPINALTVSTAQSASGVKADVSEAGLFCQAFSDAAGNTKLGGIFTSTTSASFTAASDGGVASTADQAVPIGAYCCVEKVDGFAAAGCAGNGKGSTTTAASSTTTTAAATTTAAGTTTTAAPPSSTAGGKTMRIKFDGLGELAVQEEIPADDSTVLISKTSLFEDVLDAVVVDGEGIFAPSCQAYSDESGLVKAKVGDRFGLNGATLGVDGKTTTVKSIRCRSD